MNEATNLASFATDLRQVDAGALDVGYVDAGPPDGPVVVLLHGWPYDIHSFAEVVPRLTAVGRRVLVPYLRGHGTTRIRSGDTIRNGQPAALAHDTIAFLDALGVQSATLAGFDWGARTANVIAALWPERCNGLVSVSGYLIASQASGRTPLPPAAELTWWYQFYFATDRGRDGYARDRHDFARLIWRTASPRWAFDEETFAQSAAALDNPDHVDVVIHNYRWRLGLASGEPRYDEWEEKLARNPGIGVPTVTMEGDANGAPHLDPSVYAKRFTGRYEHRTVAGGVGHNLPQEAPQQFADAVLQVSGPR
ncbi:alpha/beta hydrolase [Micromonospora sp. NPDC049240]|uniref:alpha/beta fold hydrolase n=1 Tax=Micromonospora sp. NPDC049240 TaxID=3155151 RepID=UPI0033F4C284